MSQKTEYKTVLENGVLRKVPFDYKPGDNANSIDLTDKDALRSLALSKLVAVIQSSPASVALVPAIKELLDRIDGKAPQSIMQTSQINVTSNVASMPYDMQVQIVEDFRRKLLRQAPKVIDN